MFEVNADKSIYMTRGDIGTLEINADVSDGEGHTFKVGDIVRLSLFEKGNYDNVLLIKDVKVTEETTSVDIQLSNDDTSIGGTISRPKEYWYEVELNPDTVPQTLIGYDDDGPKIFKLFPGGGD